MQADESLGAGIPNGHQRPPQIASWRHFIGLLLIGAAVAGFGFLAQHTAGGAGAEAGQLASHSQAIPVYIGAILADWALLWYVWAGVHRRGGNLATLSGGRWKSWKSLGVDLAIAVPFWLLWEGSALAVHRLLGLSSAKSVTSLLPQSLLEILIWIGASITAGICEELVFRGYLQQQLHALSGNIVAAVLGQGFVFGLGHSYQGWKNTVVICVLGVLFGILAAWRRNLRANIIVHAWADVWGGWLQMVVWK